MADPGQAAATDPKAAKSGTCRWRCAIFAYDLAVVFALLGVAWLIFQHNHVTFGSQVRDITVRAMWFGALGGLVISLKGVYDHCCTHGDWDDCFNLWHIGRPVSGALTGLVTLVLLLTVNPNTTPSGPTVYAVAFIFGTQERRFFNFLYEVAALVVRVPGDDQQNVLKGTDIQPAEGNLGDVVLIAGAGFVKGATVTFGSTKMENVVVAKDGKTIVGKVPQGAGDVDITIVNPNGDRVVLGGKFTYQAPPPHAE